MSKQEVDRSLLQAFAEASRLIAQDPNASRAYQRYATAIDNYTWTARSRGRRYRVSHRNRAHAIATAWGL